MDDLGDAGERGAVRCGCGWNGDEGFVLPLATETLKA